jgi:hypothetical protein
VQRLFRRALVLFMIAWLPLQAGALPVLVLDCELDPQGSAMHQAMHGGALHDDGHGAPADAPGAAPAHDHDGDAGHDAFGHGCCHHLSSGAAPAAPIAFLPAGAIVPVASAVHPYRFFPDLPRRPPLADLV